VFSQTDSPLCTAFRSRSSWCIGFWEALNQAPRLTHLCTCAFRWTGSENADYATLLSDFIIGKGLNSEKNASVRDWNRFGHIPRVALAPLAVGTSFEIHSSCRTFSSVHDSKRRPATTQQFAFELRDFRIEWQFAKGETRFSAVCAIRSVGL